MVKNNGLNLWKGNKLGPALRLLPHKDACDLDSLKQYSERLGGPLAIDLFCGAGGLSAGLEQAGFNVILGADIRPESIETHGHHFGGASLVIDLSLQESIVRITESLKGLNIDLVAGGPPCQPFSAAGKNKIRSLIRDGIWTESDPRTELWMSFVQIVDAVRPRAVLVENVPDMALGNDAIVFRRLLVQLERLGYQIDSRIVPTWQHGVPQHRERLIVVGMQDHRAFDWPAPLPEKTRVRAAISDLPQIEGGASENPAQYGGPQTPFQEKCREGVHPSDKLLIYDHITRAVRPDDLEAFSLMTSKTKYSDLPDRLRRYRSDIFNDKYKRLGWEELSRTTTAHLAKDGYWYIHPEQHRTLTVREAARLQTFPDHYRFAGAPSTAFRQIGEAVPPLFGEAMGHALRSALDTERHSSVVSTDLISTDLSKWLDHQEESEMIGPWHKGGSMWTVIVGLYLLERLPKNVVQDRWRPYTLRWDSPSRFITDQYRDEVLKSINRQNRGRPLLTLAAWLVANCEPTADSIPAIEGVPPSIIRIARAVTGIGYALPVTTGPLRLACRVVGQDFANSTQMEGQLILARLVGDRTDGKAYAAIRELSMRYCHASAPACGDCPIRTICQTGRRLPIARVNGINHAVPIAPQQD